MALCWRATYRTPFQAFQSGGEVLLPANPLLLSGLARDFSGITRPNFFIVKMLFVVVNGYVRRMRQPRVVAAIALSCHGACGRCLPAATRDSATKEGTRSNSARFE